MNKIDSFSGDYEFLSNFWLCYIPYDGFVWPSTENAYQAAKCADYDKRKDFTLLSPGQAKRLGRSVELIPYWETKKIDIMRKLLYIKFLLHPDLRQKLLDTGDAELIEGNTWGDTFWGVCDGVGENNLGKLLMEVRNYCRNSEIEQSPIAVTKLRIRE